MNLKYSVCVAYEDNLFYYLFERDTGKEREAGFTSDGLLCRRPQQPGLGQKPGAPLRYLYRCQGPRS